VILIEMVGYMASHLTDDTPWRCVVCEKVSKHGTEDIIPHMISEHGYDKGRLRMERMESLYLYPEAEVKDKYATAKTV
jgi:hypothetical protein